MAEMHGRTVSWLKDGWKFANEELKGASETAFDDSAWESVRIPHDWAIAGPFDESIDVHYTAIVADGETRKRNHTGRTGGLPHVGTGWYRKVFSLTDDEALRQIRVEFDGVMSHAEVFVNGQLVGGWPYGYSSFAFDISEAIHTGENLLAVRCDNPALTSRWYPGAGIYRNVRLVILPDNHVAHWGTYVTTPKIGTELAKVSIKTDVIGVEGSKIKLDTVVYDPNGIEVARASETGKVKGGFTSDQTLIIENPMLWDLSGRNLYRAESIVTSDGSTDRYETTFGLRTLIFDADEGFLLNGKKMKLNGVCMHHDLGPLGAAVNKDALERQLDSLLGMGCNAIRTSHNPPTPELLDLCDRKGLLVIDEAFDEWRIAKVDNGYHILFDEWAEKDLRAMIKRDRNHPCVIMWSIGNEILEQSRENGAETARFLSAICTDEDPTRPTTAGFNISDNAIINGLADEVAIPGWNYKPHLYAQYKREHTHWPMYGSETESCVSTRGEYYFPPEEERDVTRDTLQVTSYDVASPPWGYSPDVEFRAQEECPFMMGEFVWTGWDYLGEPTPYKTEWPSRSAYFGIVDLCGIPKDRYYAYQAQWTNTDTLHIFPHWTWPGREGELTPIHCYTNHASAELFVNGESKGVRRKEWNSMTEKYRLIWQDVVYQPGEIKIVGYDDQGQEVSQRTVRTAGKPAKIILTSNTSTIAADDDAMFFVSASVVDADGTLCPDADNSIRFSIEGSGKIAAVGNGDPTSVAPFKSDSRLAFHGRCVAYISSQSDSTGLIAVTAQSDGLEPHNIAIKTE